MMPGIDANTLNAPLRLIIWCALMMLPWPITHAQDELPDGKGKEIVEMVCTQCHSLNLLMSSHHTEQQWEQTVQDMIGFGAPLYGDEVQLVIDYLNQQLGKENFNSDGS